MTYETAGKLMECSPETVRNLAKRGDVERVQIGTGKQKQGAPRITMKSIRAYIVRQTETRTAIEA